jgi:hypothetical protein
MINNKKVFNLLKKYIYEFYYDEKFPHNYDSLDKKKTNIMRKDTYKNTEWLRPDYIFSKNIE